MKKHKLLFLDDENNVLRSLERLFQDSEYEVHTANNANEALKMLEENKYSLILSDYRMPEMNGVEFLKVAKKKSPESIRMILTGFADVDVAISAINEGEIYKFVEKPWDGEQLKVHIKRAIEFYEVTEERKELLEKIKQQNEELKGLNENLEQKVQEKTKELMKAYEELKLKVKELEGRDRILQSLLTINDFEDTLTLILDVILNIVAFDEIIIYVIDEEQGKLFARAGYSSANGKKIKITDRIKDFPSIPTLRCNSKSTPLDVEKHQIDKIDDNNYLIPIWKENKCIGALLINNSRSKNIIGKKEFEIISGFASLAALAINDYLTSFNLSDVGDKINEMLGE